MSQIKTKFLTNNAVTNTKLAQMSAHTYKGNNTGSTSNSIDVTSTQLTADLNQFGSALQGLVSASGGGVSNFLRADNTWVGVLQLTGGTMSGVINMGSNKIISVTDPTSAQDAATKNYVDTVASGLQPLQSVYAGTAGSNIPGTYVNGVSGIGATFTTTSTSTFTLDGTTPPLNSRILIKDQTTGFQNGVYNFTSVPVGGVSGAVFTRAFDFDTPSDMNSGAIIPIMNGTVNSSSGNPTFWIQTATITNVGVDSLIFIKFNQGGSGTVTSVAASVPAFLSVAGSPITASGTLAITLSGTALPIANGGTAVTSVTTAPAATAFAGWDANKNLSANSHLQGYATTATAAGTTTLIVGSAELQYFTGTTTQTVILPVTSTLVLGQKFIIVNNSTGVVTVQSSGTNTIKAMAANTQLVVVVILTSGTTAASWATQYSSTTAAGSILIAPTVQKFTSGSGTYTTPTINAPLYIRVRLVGGGGGGAGSSTVAANNGGTGGTGGDTTFGPITGSGGTGGHGTNNSAGGTGGAATLGSGPIGTPIPGSPGGGSGESNITGYTVGAAGGPAPFFAGNGGSSIAGGTAGTGVTNTGGGGGGATNVASANSNSGGGGGSGGFVDAIIAPPAATYSYGVGAAGTAGTAGTSGTAGGAGGSGYIEVTEYYQ